MATAAPTTTGCKAAAGTASGTPATTIAARLISSCRAEPHASWPTPYAAATAALAAAGCANESDSDSLTTARRHLRIAACGPAPAVAGAAGVNDEPRRVYLGDWVLVAVCHLDAFVKTAEAQQQPITLFIEGLDSGNQPTGVDLDHGILTFELDRSEANKELWRPLLYSPLFDRTTSMRCAAWVECRGTRHIAARRPRCRSKRVRPLGGPRGGCRGMRPSRRTDRSIPPATSDRGQVPKG